jgi:beta-glucosidase
MAGRTYRYMTHEPLYPFGFGLSYTRFDYSDLTISAGPHKQGRAIPFSVRVQNTGGAESEEVVQVYLKTPHANTPSPRYSLVGMQRIRLAPGKQTEMKLSLDPQSMRAVNADGTSTQRSGTYELWVGGCSPDPRAVELGAAPPMHAKFEIT